MSFYVRVQRSSMIKSTSEVHCGFESRSAQTKEYKIGISWFFANAHITKEKDQGLVGSKSGLQRSSMIKSIMGSQIPSHREWLLISANSAMFRSWIFDSASSLEEQSAGVYWFQMRYVCLFCWYCKCRIVYHHCLDFLFIIIINLITIILFCLFLDVNENRDNPPKLVQTIPFVLGYMRIRSQVMVTLPVFSLFTIYCSSPLTSWVITLALFKAQKERKDGQSHHDLWSNSHIPKNKWNCLYKFGNYSYLRHGR
jgi:hypothetical protein